MMPMSALAGHCIYRPQASARGLVWQWSTSEIQHTRDERGRQGMVCDTGASQAPSTSELIFFRLLDPLAVPINYW